MTRIWTAHGPWTGAVRWPVASLSGWPWLVGQGLQSLYSHTELHRVCAQRTPPDHWPPTKSKAEPLHHVSTLSVDEARQAAQAGRSITAKVPDSFMRPSGVGCVASCVALFSRPCSAGPPACPRRARARLCARTAPGWVRVRGRVHRAGLRVLGWGWGWG